MRTILISLCLLLFFVRPAMSGSYPDSFCSTIDPARYKGEHFERLMADIKSRDENVRAMAADTLSCLGDKALPAVPSMIELFREPNGEARLNMILAVARLGRTAVPALTAALDSKDKDLRRGACIALKEIGPDTRSALPALKKLLDEPGYDVSLAAEGAIKRISNSKEK